MDRMPGVWDSAAFMLRGPPVDTAVKMLHTVALVVHVAILGSTLAWVRESSDDGNELAHRLMLIFCFVVRPPQHQLTLSSGQGCKS